MPTDAGSEPEPSRSFRDRPLGRILILLAVLALAFVAVKSCASRDTEIDSDEALAIAREEVDYAPDRVMVRFTPRGFDSRPFWSVSLSTLDEDGLPEEITVVLVNARTGEVEQVQHGQR
ncbi:MAG: hypothetical protein ACRDMA_11885 [Solirubrobacterales bacterium]